MQIKPLPLSAIVLCLIHFAVAADTQNHHTSNGPRPSPQTRNIGLPSSPDNWLGGTGNWSNGTDWSSGLPGSTSDVTIYTGHDDVTLDTSSSINSLTLGGSGGLMTSTLIGDGNAHTLTIAGSLTVNDSGYLQLLNDTVTASTATNSGTIDVSSGSTLQINGNFTNNSGALLSSGFLASGGGNTINITGTFTNVFGGTLYVLGSGDVANIGQLANQGDLVVGTGTTLNLTNQPNGITDVAAGSDYEVYGTFTAGGNPALAGLTTVEGTVIFGNTQTNNVNPAGGTLTLTGGLLVDYGTVVNIQGNLNAAGGGMATGIDAGGNTLAISGSLTLNSAGSLELFGQADLVSMAALNNAGNINVIGGSTLQVNGDVVNSGCIGECGDVAIRGGNSYEVSGTFTNQASGVFYTLNDDTANLGGLVNSGFVRLGPGTHLTAGSISLNPGSGLGIDIDGPNHFGMLMSTGGVGLNGLLYVYLDNGYTPPVGTAFKFLTFTPGALSGTFSGVLGFGENFAVQYDNSAGYVEVIAEGNSTVPEPSSFLLFGSGMLGVAALMRRNANL